MSSYNRFFKNVGLYFLGNFATKILQFLFIPIYSIYVDVKDYGEYNYVLSIISLALPILFCEIWEGVFRFAIERKGKEYSVISTTTIFLLSSLCLYTAIFLIVQHFFPIKHSFYILLLAIVNTIAPYWQFSSRALSLNKTYTLSTIVSSFVSISLNIILIVVFHLGIEALYTANILGGLALIIVIECKAKIISHIKLSEWDKKLLKSILIYSIPLAINAISWWLYTTLNNLIITENLGLTQNGIYSMAMRFGTILSLFTLVINMAWLEESFRINEDDDKDVKFSTVLLNLTSFLFAAFIILIPLGALIYKYFVFNEYKVGLYLLPLIFLSAIFSTLTNHLGSAFLAAKDSKSMFWTTLVGGLISLSLSLTFIKIWGMFGAVLGSTCGFISVYYIRIYILNNYKGYSIRWHNNFILMMFLFLIPLNVLIAKYDNLPVLILLFICMLAIGLYANKSIIVLAINKMRKK